MTNEQNQVKKIAIYTFLGIVFWVIVGLIYFKGCTPTPQPTLSNSTLDSKKYINEYKRKALTDKLNVMQKNDIIYVDRWHKAKAVTNTIVDSVFITAPDTCTPYLRIIENRLFTERQIADSSIAIKDSIISTQSQIIKTDSVLLWVAKSETKLANDSIPKVWAQVKKQNRKSVFKTIVRTAEAIVVVVGAVIIYNKFR